MTTSQHIIIDRQEAEEVYRQAISLVRSLARQLGYPCPIASRQERRNPVREEIDKRGIMEVSGRAYPDEEAEAG